MTFDSRRLHSSQTSSKAISKKKIVVAGPKEQFQTDLIDCSRLQKYNGSFKFILVVIDVFSKYAYVECMKNKTFRSIIAFSKILKRSSYFSTLQTNLGTEFTNQAF